MIEETLFHLPEAEPAPPEPPVRREHVRVLRPVREQVQWLPRDLEAAVAEEHPARAIWDFLERVDLQAFYGSIKAVLDGPGRPTTDPQVLLAVWVMGVLDDVGSARQLARLCEQHDVYRWLCGGVPINYHMLSDFRVAHEEGMDELLTEIVARLRAAGAAPVRRIAQDGMRVRASAGAGSYRRREKLEVYREEARREVARLAEQREHPDRGVSRRQQAARERAARERVERVEAALAYLPRVEQAKAVQSKRAAKTRRITQPRVSTTDPEARVMKMPDGGFRPAFNVQFATDSEHGVIVGVRVTDAGSDGGQASPMLEQIERRIGAKPGEYLVDGGFAARDDITSLERKGVTVYAPVRHPKWKPSEERYQPRYGDSPEVIAWRERMASEEGKAIYRQRGAIAEWTNAQVTAHGLSRITVRGLTKVTTVALLIAVAHNLMRLATLA